MTMDCITPVRWRGPCISSGWRVNVKLIGIILIVVGIAALAMGGFSYTKREKVLDIGPLQATTETRKTIPITPVAGVAALAGGIALLVVGSKSRV